MDLFHWDEMFETGDPEIDDQHKALFQLGNRLHEAILEGRGSEISEEIGNALQGEAVRHFSLEERLMRRMGFPGIEEHIWEHRRFLEGVERSSLDGQKATPLQTMQLVQAMIRGHIMEVDLPMIRWIRSRKHTAALDSTMPSALNAGEDW